MADSSVPWRLPHELLVHIFSFLPEVGDKQRAAQVCRAWRDAANVPSLWRNVVAVRLYMGPPQVLVDLKRPLEPQFEAIRRQQTLEDPPNFDFYQCLADRNLLSLKVTSRGSTLKDIVINFPEMESLEFSGELLHSWNDHFCEVEFWFSEAFGQPLHNLTTLKLYHTPLVISDNLVELLARNAANLETLELESCDMLTESALFSVSRLVQLRSLKMIRSRRNVDALIGCLSYLEKARFPLTAKISGEDLNRLGSFYPTSRTMSLNNCHLVTDDGLEQLSRLPRLVSLVFDSCRMTQAGMASLASMSSLRRLSLDRGDVRDTSLVGLLDGRGSRIAELSIIDCRVTDVGVREYLGRLVNLKKVNLEICLNVSAEAVAFLRARGVEVTK